MSGVIWTKFFWSDWESDPALRICSFAAQGLWMRLLCIASAHEPIGYVAVAGRGLTAEDIARMTGGSLAEVSGLLAELESNGVFSRDRNQRIYSRRMTKDAKKAAVAVKNGKLGGNPSLSNSKEKNGQVNPHIPVPVPVPKKVSPPSQPLQASLLADASETVQQPKAKEAEFGAFYAAFPRHIARGAAETAYWRARKTASAAALLAGAQAYAAARKGEDDKFTKYPATWLNGKCWMDGDAGQAVGPEAAPTTLWVWRLEAFHQGKPDDDDGAGVPVGYWQAKWGPQPGQAACCVPAEAIAAYAAQHPPRATGTGS